MSTPLRILVVFLLVLGNAIFVAAEYALVTARRSRLEERAERGGRGARTALRLMDDPVRFISTVQVGITVSAILLGAIGEPLVSEFFEPPLSAAVSFLIAFAILTYLSVVLGELVPKAVALQRAEVLAIALAVPLDWLARISYPLVWLLQKSANRRPARAASETRSGGDDRLHARGHPPQRRRGRRRRRAARGGGGDAVQGLRLRVEGGVRGHGAAAGRRRDLGRDASGGGATSGRRLAVHAVSGLPRLAGRGRRHPPRPRSLRRDPRLRDRVRRARVDRPSRPTSCRRRRISRRSSPTSAARSSTWRSSSTSTATWTASSRSRTCSRRSSATSRTSSIFPTRRSSASTRRTSASTGRTRSTTSTRSSRPSSSRTGSTPWRGSCSASSAVRPRSETPSESTDCACPCSRSTARG